MTTLNESPPLSSFPQKVGQGMSGRWLIFLIVSITVVALAIGGGTLAWIHQDFMDTEGETLAMVAVGLARQLHQTVVERKNDVRLLAKAPTLLSRDLDQIQRYLTQVAETSQAFEALSFVSVDGTVLASNRFEIIGQDLTSEFNFGTFRQGPREEIQDFQPNQFFDGALILSLVSPVFTESGEFHGMIVGHINHSYVRKIFEKTVHLFEEQRGATLEWQLLNQEGLVLVDSILKEAGQVNLREIFLPSAWAVVETIPGFVKENHLRRQVPVITGFARMEGFYEAPGFHWGTLVRRDQADVLAALKNFETRLGIAGVGIALPMIGLLVMLIRRLQASQEETVRALAVAQANEEGQRQLANENRDLMNRNALILESVAEGIYGLDCDGITTFVNSAAAKMLGYDPGELIGMPMHATVHHTKIDGIFYPREDCPMYAAIRDNTVQHVNNEVLWRKDGSSFYVEYSSTPMQNDVGETIGVVVTFRDVTERKRVEAALLDAMTLTQGIVDTAADGIITIDEQGLIESFNKAASKTFGYEEAEVLGKNISMLMPSPYHERHDGYLAHYRQTGEKKIIGIGREVVGKRKDGSEFTLELSVSEVEMGSRRVFTGIVRDVTERKEGERQLGLMYKRVEKNNKELREARDEALQAVKMKGEFLAMMSHEIRTPMNGVLGMTGLLLETELTKDQRECAETVKHSADALLTIINDILDFSKIESGKLDIEVIDFDLRIAIEDVLDLVGGKAQEKGLELVGLIYASVPTAVRGDPGRVRQILLNLVGNAIKFTEQGEVVVQVVPEIETPESVTIRIDVTDTGIGLNAEARERLFKPFSQADSSTTRKFGGTGLGLAICKQLTELMHGHIGIESAPGHGSRFWFTIQLEKQANQKNNEIDPSANLKGLRVCVVDDNDTNRLLMHHYAQAWGMTCLSAETGPKALALLADAVNQGEPCDLLILDYQMPVMTGLELAKKVKADPVLKDIKIVLATSLGRRGDAAAAKEAGIAAYLTKPLHHNQLRDCLVQVMKGTGSAEEGLITKYTLRELQRRQEGRLLVADDNIVNQKVAVRMLEKLGYRVDVVANGCEAVEAVSRITYDAVLMDCQMPEMDGFEATREIRSRESTRVKREAENGENSEGSFPKQDPLHQRPATGDQRRIPIIAMTANAMQGDREKCLNAGMDDFVSKPVKIEALETALMEWVRPKESPTLHIPQHNPQPGETVTMTAQSDNQSVASPLDAETLDGLRELSGDDPSFLAEVIQQFLHDGPGHVSAIGQAAKQANADALMKAAHGFKGSCRNMGALSLGNLCLSLEEKGRGGDTTQLEGTLSQLTEEYSRVQVALEAELAKISMPSA
jgi:two-component system, sensor histidine kinase and response regulator